MGEQSKTLESTASHCWSVLRGRSSVGWNACLSRRRSRVRVPSLPPHIHDRPLPEKQKLFQRLDCCDQVHAETAFIKATIYSGINRLWCQRCWIVLADNNNFYLRKICAKPTCDLQPICIAIRKMVHSRRHRQSWGTCTPRHIERQNPERCCQRWTPASAERCCKGNL